MLEHLEKRQGRECSSLNASILLRSTDLSLRQRAIERMLCSRNVEVNLKDRMTGIDANLDDLQSGVDACTRMASTLQTEAARFDQVLKRIHNAPLISSLERRAEELKACLRDQRGALQELREGVARLQEELTQSNGSVTPPVEAGVRQRRESRPAPADRRSLRRR